jgi:uncharacterized protein (UPF0305 family)
MAESSAFKANNRWICENTEKLKERYNNQWIAVLNQAVIDSGSDLRKLVDRLKTAHSIDYPEIAVEYIDAAAETEEANMDFENLKQ